LPFIRLDVARPVIGGRSGHTVHVTDQPDADNPYAPPPPDWQPPAVPPYGAPTGWAPQQPPYAAPPGWQPAPPPYGTAPAGAPPPGGGSADPNQPPHYPVAPAWQPQYAPGQPYGAAPGWAPGYQPYGYPQPSTTNGFAVASLVCSIVLSWLFGVGGVLGVVFGIIGIKQCARQGERGRGIAIAGIVLGGIAIAFWLVILIAVVAVHGSNGGGNGGSLGALGLHATM
jgi:hypothetical protein